MVSQCGCCGDELVKRPNESSKNYAKRLYCSKRCANKSIKRRTKHEVTLRPCLRCGAEIPRNGRHPSHYAKATYCTQSCAAKSHTPLMGGIPHKGSAPILKGTLKPRAKRGTVAVHKYPLVTCECGNRATTVIRFHIMAGERHELCESQLNVCECCYTTMMTEDKGVIR